MNSILLLNGGKAFAHSNGQYHATLHDAAVAFLDRAGFDPSSTAATRHRKKCRKSSGPMC